MSELERVQCKFNAVTVELRVAVECLSYVQKS